MVPISKIMLYLTVFMTGAVVMVLELLGTRIIAPFYGNGLVVWASLISVTLVSLALGYFIGGWFADALQGQGLNFLLFLSAFSVLLIPHVHASVLLWSEGLGMHFGALASATLLFMPALVFLGMVSPLAVRISGKHAEKIGSVAGNLYATSTIGSVCGTLSLGFLLFPYCGSSEILKFSAFLLLACGLLITQRFGPGLISFGLVIGAFGFIDTQTWSPADRNPSQNGFRLIEAKESLYGWVRVLDNRRGDSRLLASDASVIGAATLSSNQNLLAYQDIVQLLPRIRPEIRRALLIGQGAGHMAMQLRDRFGIRTDTIEIDPVVDQYARKYFGFNPTGTTLIGDGRYFIRKIEGPYDLIIHDCFTGGSEPTHLLTVETLTLLRDKLSDGGMLALNFVGMLDRPDHAALASVSRTFSAVFPVVSLYQSEPGESFNDFVFLGSLAPLPEQNNLRSEDIEWLSARRLDLSEQDGVVLTDDYNPLESLQFSKAEHYRKLVRAWLGDAMIIR